MVALLAVSGAFAALQRSFVYFPLSHRPPPVASALPGAEDITLTTADGLTLPAWYRAPRGGAATVLVLNGNAGDRSHRAPLAAALANEGLGVLLFDYRGYAGNPGTPSEPGLLADARAAADALVARGTDPRRLVYFGESLGAAVAVELAAERPPAALILRSPFTSLEAMARVHYPWLPIAPLLVDRYDSIDHIKRVRAPVLVIAGGADRIVPAADSRALAEAANGRFVLFDGLDHNDPALSDGPALLREAVRFIAEHAAPG